MILFLAGMLVASALIALGGFLFATFRPPVSNQTQKPYPVLDRSDRAVAAMERARRDGTSARPPARSSVVYDQQAPTPGAR